MSAPATALGVFPHPDDEAYAAGGLLALAARRGARVLIACATAGEAGGAARRRELEASCEALGAEPPLWLGLRDGAVDRGAPEVFATLLAETRPRLVVTLGGDGAYGHVDHLACTRLLGTAIAAVPPAERPRLLHAEFPRGVFGKVCRALRRSGAAPIDPAIAPDELGIAPARAELRLDIRAVRDAKLAAIAAHVSQLPGGDPFAFLRGGVVEHLLDEELYTVADGPPLPRGAADPFDVL